MVPTASAASVLRSLERPFAAVRGSMAVVRKHIFSNIILLVSTYVRVDGLRRKQGASTNLQGVSIDWRCQTPKREY